MDVANASTKVNGVYCDDCLVTPEVRALAAPSQIMAGVYTDGGSLVTQWMLLMLVLKLMECTVTTVLSLLK